MTIRNGPEGMLLVDLPGEPALEEELAEAFHLVRTGAACNVVMDFSQVTVLNSNYLATLLRLHNYLREHAGRLVLCNLEPATRGIFAITGLTEVFEIAGDMQNALLAVGI